MEAEKSCSGAKTRVRTLVGSWPQGRTPSSRETGTGMSGAHAGGRRVTDLPERAPRNGSPVVAIRIDDAAASIAKCADHAGGGLVVEACLARPLRRDRHGSRGHRWRGRGRWTEHIVEEDARLVALIEGR